MRFHHLGLAAGLLLLAAPPANAARVSVSSETEEEGTLVSYTLSAAAGEANRVTVTTRPPAGKQRTVVFRDAGAPLTPGEGCQAGSAGEVVCSAELGDFANSVDVLLQDGDDRADTSAVSLRGFTVFVDAGTGSDTAIGSRSRVNALFGDFVNSEVGDDRLTGGRRDDFLQGGRGADSIDGRGGSDEVTFRDERRRVRADLAAGFALSAAGERDRLRSIERIEGGDGADVLRGSAARNVIFGLAGDDKLGGRGGDDQLSGGPGADRLFGGPGRDLLFGGPGRDLFDAGPGADQLRAADRRAEQLRCGAGVDRLRADRADSLSQCEVVNFG